MHLGEPLLRKDSEMKEPQNGAGIPVASFFPNMYVFALKTDLYPVELISYTRQVPNRSFAA